EQQASDTFDPAPYKDEVRTRIEAAVQKKVEGQEITMTEAPEGGGQVIDLMEALRASLERKAPGKARESQAAASETHAEARESRPAARETAARKPPQRAQDTETRARKTAKK
ncbi:MAG TPA: Ku protein, partial [Candidatus Polarisedimenticolia bacterium]|nr:Ku protein [Candidatus Polarisedimenticolia bacterium]